MWVGLRFDSPEYQNARLEVLALIGVKDSELLACLATSPFWEVSPGFPRLKQFAACSICSKFGSGCRCVRTPTGGGCMSVRARLVHHTTRKYFLCYTSPQVLNVGLVKMLYCVSEITFRIRMLACPPSPLSLCIRSHLSLQKPLFPFHPLKVLARPMMMRGCYRRHPMTRIRPPPESCKGNNGQRRVAAVLKAMRRGSAAPAQRAVFLGPSAAWVALLKWCRWGRSSAATASRCTP